LAEPSSNPWLHRFAVLTAIATFVLLGAGGLVTSHGAGMAVPDWPNTYGYNMFFFPFSKWVGGIFYEHTHRLIASGVGMLTGILALWLYGRRARTFMSWSGLILILLGFANDFLYPSHWRDGLIIGLTGLLLFGASYVWPRRDPSPTWLRRLGVLAFVAVVAQGVLGGLRVVLLENQIGIFHATLAQLFFSLICAIALFTSKWWRKLGLLREGREESAKPRTQPATDFLPLLGGQALPLKLIASTTGLIFLQLILGATMRHQHAGLAIPDFPLAYGRLWPATDAQSVAGYNEHRIEVIAARPITAFQIDLQMIHRIVALLILAGVGLSAWQVRRRVRGEAGMDRRELQVQDEGCPATCPPKPQQGRKAGAGREHGGDTLPRALGEPQVASAILSAASRLTWTWLGLTLVQVTLGALTIWSNKAADIATAHVMTGALLLATGVMLCIISSQSPKCARSAPVLSGSGAGAPSAHALSASKATA
jgi:heme a synthase